MQIPPEPNFPNQNDRATLERLRNTVLENLRNVRPVGAAMHNRPPDAAAPEELRSSGSGRERRGSDMEEDREDRDRE